MKAKSSRISTAVQVVVSLILTCAFLFFALFSRAGLGSIILDPAWWGLCGLGSAVFLATSSSYRARIAFGLATLACTVVAVYQLPYFLPLQQRVTGAAFVEAPLPDVLHVLSEQRQSKPYRRFVICDTQTLNKRVTISIPDGCTLGRALQIIAGASATEYDWHWWSWCGNTYPPTSAKIYFYAAGGTMTKGLWEIDRNRLWLRDPNGMPISGEDGVLVPSVNVARRAK